MTNNIRKLEVSLLDPKTRASAKKLDKLIAEDFIEFGASGKIYNKAQLLDALPKEEDIDFNISDFKETQLADNIIQATYKIEIDNIKSLRSSIWKLNKTQWQIIFHQGTKI